MGKKLLCLLVVALVILSALSLTGCNRQIVDLHYNFTYAMVSMPDGTIVSGKVDSWRDYSDSDAIQVTIDGKTYYTFLGNVVLYD